MKIELCFLKEFSDFSERVLFKIKLFPRKKLNVFKKKQEIIVMNVPVLEIISNERNVFAKFEQDNLHL